MTAEWKVGTDFRSEDGKVYTLGEQQFSGLTTILDACLGNDSLQFAHADWIEAEVHTLMALHAGKQQAKRTRLLPVSDDRNEWIIEECDPMELIHEKGYLKFQHLRMQSRAADRGTVVHKVLSQWRQDRVYISLNLADWVAETIYNGEGKTPYRCDYEETLSFCRSLVHWLETNKVEVLRSEFPCFSREFGFACTCDALISVDGEIWLIDAKTRSKVQPTRRDALQLVGQATTEFTLAEGSLEEKTLSDLWPIVRIGSLQVAPDRVVLRELAKDERLSKAWAGCLLIWNNLVKAPLPFTPAPRGKTAKETK